MTSISKKIMGFDETPEGVKAAKEYKKAQLSKVKYVKKVRTASFSLCFLCCLFHWLPEPFSLDEMA